jgi:hypothetical protein
MEQFNNYRLLKLRRFECQQALGHYVTSNWSLLMSLVEIEYLSRIFLRETVEVHPETSRSHLDYSFMFFSSNFFVLIVHAIRDYAYIRAHVRNRKLLLRQTTQKKKIEAYKNTVWSILLEFSRRDAWELSCMRFVYLILAFSAILNEPACACVSLCVCVSVYNSI